MVQHNREVAKATSFLIVLLLCVYLFNTTTFTLILILILEAIEMAIIKDFTVLVYTQKEFSLHLKGV